MPPTFKTRLPWWKLIGDAEWLAMTPVERMLVKAAIPVPPVVVCEGDPGVLSVDIDGWPLRDDQRLTMAITLTMS